MSQFSSFHQIFNVAYVYRFSSQVAVAVAMMTTKTETGVAAEETAMKEMTRITIGVRVAVVVMTEIMMIGTVEEAAAAVAVAGAQKITTERVAVSVISVILIHFVLLTEKIFP